MSKSAYQIIISWRSYILILTWQISFLDKIYQAIFESALNQQQRLNHNSGLHYVVNASHHLHNFVRPTIIIVDAICNKTSILYCIMDRSFICWGKLLPNCNTITYVILEGLTDEILCSSNAGSKSN